ncbi:nucleotidyltransferase family protein [Desulfobacterota bacterium AH_259_B03_O07]|nr:nucleotidyltransferase family protein [Desulfobacterota bacterium AH_259_B03_O07]
MIAILLCAGFATRMYPITKNYPKPLLEVGGRPMLDYLMDQLVEIPRLDSLHIVTNEIFYSYFREWEKRWNKIASDNRIKLYLHNDGATKNENRLGAIKDLAFVINLLKRIRPTIVTAGDNIYRFLLEPIIQEFIESKKNIVLALTETDHSRKKKKGILELGPDNKVLKFHEKPENVRSNWACPPIYLLQPSALTHVNEYMERNDIIDAPGNFIAYLVDREPVYAVKVDGKRLDIGTIKSYEEAKEILSKEPVILE